MPTTTVSASRMRETAAILSSMRPMKLSTISKAEISIKTPFAPWATILLVRSSSSAVARRSCMSTWMVTSSASPNFNIGMRSISLALLSRARILVSLSRLYSRDCFPSACERERKRVSQRGFGNHVQFDAEMHQGLSDLRPDAADDAIGAHQARRRYGLQKVLRRQSIAGRHACDVDNGARRALVDDGLKKILHHDLRALAVQRADNRQSEHALPEFDDRRRQLGDLALLTKNDLFAAFLID